MDGFLALIVAMLLFALLIFIINRRIKTIVFLGMVVSVVLVLRALGVFG